MRGSTGSANGVIQIAMLTCFSELAKSRSEQPGSGHMSSEREFAHEGWDLGRRCGRIGVGVGDIATWEPSSASGCGTTWAKKYTSKKAEPECEIFYYRSRGGSSSLVLARKHIIAPAAGGRWMPSLSEKDHARFVLFFSWMNNVVGLSLGTE